MSEWQPIETAPKKKGPDHELLTWDESDEIYWLAYWNGLHWIAEDGIEVEPSHWMALPEPPK